MAVGKETSREEISNFKAIEETEITRFQYQIECEDWRRGQSLGWLLGFWSGWC